MSEKYTYNIASDFPNQKVDLAKLKLEIEAAAITKALDYINATETICDIWFKAALGGGEETVLDSVVDAHDGEHLDDEAPHMPDGRPIVRADTRPLDTQTYFTCSGDDQGIGDGNTLQWDFSNNDDLVPSGSVPAGYKAKEILIKFNCPVYLKDGAIYFFDAPWGQYMHMDIMVPSGGYYPNPEGQIPASALGLPGNDMYAQAPSGSNVLYQRYVNHHKVYGDCPMGDELNAEGASVDAVPVGWFLRGFIVTPVSDNVSKGYASMELYRCHSVLLPGQDVEDLH